MLTHSNPFQLFAEVAKHLTLYNEYATSGPCYAYLLVDNAKHTMEKAIIELFEHRNAPLHMGTEGVPDYNDPRVKYVELWASPTKVVTLLLRTVKTGLLHLSLYRPGEDVTLGEVYLPFGRNLSPGELWRAVQQDKL